jgi:two-component system phosphate regulon sensor histidine kinase PhoR
MSNQTEKFKPRVLVVDDEKRIRDACQTMLSMEGFEVAMAATGDEGLAKIEAEHFDIVLLDLMMPGISGFDALDRVKSLHPDTAIIVITGYATLEHTIEAMKKGAFDLLPKPFSPQDLRVVIKKALEFIRTLQDITNEKSRMRVLINHLDGGVMAADAGKKVALANPAFLRMMGYAGDEITGRSVTDLVQDETLLSMIDEALDMPGDAFTELNEEIGLRDRILGARCVPFRDRLGRTLGAITVLHDITDTRKMDQLKSEFVSMVAHEIRSPMNSVLMQLKVILDGLAGDVTNKQNEILSRASDRIKALVSMSTELLDLARIESGLITQEKEKMNLAPMLEDQVNFHQPKAEEKQIKLELRMPDSKLPPVLANPTNMEEVLVNLITNAIKYSPENTTVTVEARVDGEYLRVSVADNGFGISPEDQERVFDRFYRVKNEETRYITGTGLGLPIVKSIVEAHNGQLRLESEIGKGTTFHVLLPVMDT